MRDLQAIADRFQAKALRGTHAGGPMTRDRDRLAPPFTHDSAWQIPDGRHTGMPEEMRHRAACKQPWPAPLGEPSCPKHDR